MTSNILFHSTLQITGFGLVWLGLWCLMPLSTIFQLYRGHQPAVSH